MKPKYRQLGTNLVCISLVLVIRGPSVCIASPDKSRTGDGRWPCKDFASHVRDVDEDPSNSIRDDGK